jgi:hypothetical protein
LPPFCRCGVRETCGCRASHYSTLSAAPLSVRPAELGTHQSVLLRVEKSIQIDTLLPLLPFPVACASKRALRLIFKAAAGFNSTSACRLQELVRVS